jgi:oxaloacetate decarboxylase beta subunit
MDPFLTLFRMTGISEMTGPNFLMILVGMLLVWLAVGKRFEPLLLLPIGFGVLVGNIPSIKDIDIGVYDPNSVMNLIYGGVTAGLFPPLMFLGLGAMTDFSGLLSNPKLALLGIAAQVGILFSFLGAMWLGDFTQTADAGAIAIAGAADGLSATFLASKISLDLVPPIAVAAFTAMALLRVIQPPVMRLLTTSDERKIRMKAPRMVSKAERIIFPVAAFLITAAIAPAAVALLGMFFFGNLLKESCVTEKLANTARNALMDTVTILLGFAVGVSTDVSRFQSRYFMIFVLTFVSVIVATAAGILCAKLMNAVCKDKVNPLIGAAGLGAMPYAAHVAHTVGQKEDPQNFLLMHAMAPNIAGLIGSAVAAGLIWAVVV